MHKPYKRIYAMLFALVILFGCNDNTSLTSETKHRYIPDADYTTLEEAQAGIREVYEPKQRYILDLNSDDYFSLTSDLISDIQDPCDMIKVINPLGEVLGLRSMVLNNSVPYWYHPLIPDGKTPESELNPGFQLLIRSKLNFKEFRDQFAHQIFQSGWEPLQEIAFDYREYDYQYWRGLFNTGPEIHIYSRLRDDITSGIELSVFSVFYNQSKKLHLYIKSTGPIPLEWLSDWKEGDDVWTFLNSYLYEYYIVCERFNNSPFHYK
jgi:hypothetical protein